MPMKTAASQPSPTPRGKRHPEAPASRLEKPSPLRLTWEAATFSRWAKRGLSPPRRPDIPGDPCCFVTAALLFPDMEPGPAIDAQAKRSNFHVLWDTDKLTGRLAEVAAGKTSSP